LCPKIDTIPTKMSVSPEVSSGQAKLANRLGHAANSTEDFAHAREAFLAVATRTGRIEARVSAANMRSKLAVAAGVADVGTAAHHAEEARREYDLVLAHPRCTPAVSGLCRQKQAELSALLAQLDAHAAAEAHAAANELSPAGGKRKRGAVSKLPAGAGEMLSLLPLPTELGTGEVLVNRSPVRVLWAAVNAQRLGYSWAAALSLGSASAGIVARAKGRALGLHPAGGEQAEEDAVAQESVGLMGMRCGTQKLAPVSALPRKQMRVSPTQPRPSPTQPRRAGAPFSHATTPSISSHTQTASGATTPYATTPSVSPNKINASLTHPRSIFNPTTPC